MLLKSIRIKDFRQFIGEQSVDFSIDPTSNVTVIMGANGSGKTSLAQAFTWCLYGDTSFTDKSLLCKVTEQNMFPNMEENVRVELDLIHNKTNYTIIREQKYRKDSSGNLKYSNQTSFAIAYKTPEGQREYVKDLETEFRMKEILPKELSRYFFFDGERIEKMSKDLHRGHTTEFPLAVRGLLGLNALEAAISHLKGNTNSNSVIRNYEKSYDPGADNRIKQYTDAIDDYDKKILEIEKELIVIEEEEIFTSEKCIKLTEKINANESSQKLAEDRIKAKKKLQDLVSTRSANITSLLKSFNKHAASYLSKKPIRDTLQFLSEADKLEHGIPDIHARTIEFIVNRGRCLCGSEIKPGNDAHMELIKIINFIPPRSIGNLITEFIGESKTRIQSSSDFFENITDKFSQIRSFDSEYGEIEKNINLINEKLQGMENVGELQKELMKYEKHSRELKNKRDILNQNKGKYQTSRDRLDTERNSLNLKNDNNVKIEKYKAYAQFIHSELSKLYSDKETETRIKLEEIINEIFKTIYNGGFALTIDEKYNIQIVVTDLQGYAGGIETSTAQSISIIFAFIAGIIKMAKINATEEQNFLVSEPYPLVMDAPLSAFDTTRIKTVCDTLPNIAEQVIIFIKDTDGQIAETHMHQKIGKRYLFDKRQECETYLIER